MPAQTTRNRLRAECFEADISDRERSDQITGEEVGGALGGGCPRQQAYDEIG